MERLAEEGRDPAASAAVRIMKIVALRNLIEIQTYNGCLAL
jgi:hypothetical protein